MNDIAWNIASGKKVHALARPQSSSSETKCGWLLSINDRTTKPVDCKLCLRKLRARSSESGRREG